jgi:hypothetical protein
MAINGLFDWIIDNKDWLFSGVGIVVIGIIVKKIREFLNSKKTNKLEPTDIPAGHHNTSKVPEEEELSNDNTTYRDSSEEKKLSNDSFDDEMCGLVDRFISVYTNHGISINQISSFVDPAFGLKISDFKNNDSILEVIDDKLLNWTCNAFCIERDWLDGTSERIYQHRNYYKNVEGFSRLFVKLKNEYRDGFEIYLLKNGELDPNLFVHTENCVIIILRYPLKKINKKTIYAYMPISTQWKRGYWRTRYQLKSIIYICDKLQPRTYIIGYDMDMETINKILAGRIFPGPEIDKLELKEYTWYPEDYIDLPSESVKAKETTETEKVREYILDESYLDYFEKQKQKYSW